MPKLYIHISVFIILCLFANCKKEVDSVQSNLPDQDPFSIVVNGNARMQIHGKYVFDLPCDTSHYITVPVQVNKPGAWALQTDSINGLKFKGAGEFSSTGLQTIKLYGTGSPAEPENTVFKLKVGDQEVFDTLLPLKSYLDIDINGTRYLGLEYPSGAGELRSGSQFQYDNGTKFPSCEYYNAPDPLGNFQLVIDYKGFPSYPGVEESTQWEAYSPAKYSIADINSPNNGFRFKLKNVAASELTTDKVINDDQQFVRIISRGQYSANIFVQGQTKTLPVYRLKIEFAAKLGDGFLSPSTIRGEAIVAYWSMNAY